MDAELLTTIETAFNGVKSGFMDVVGKALPVGVGILSVTLAITLGIKFFRKVTGK